MSLDDVIIPPESAEEAQLRRNLQSRWWEKLAARPAATLHRHITPGKLLMFGSESGEQCLIAPGISLDYVVFSDSSGICLHIDGDRGMPADRQLEAWPAQSDWEKAAYDCLQAHKEGIEAAFGAALEWNDTFISWDTAGGFASPEHEWDEIIASQVGAMNKLHAAVMPYAANLPAYS